MGRDLAVCKRAYNSGSHMKCRAQDCFVCPYPDCINENPSPSRQLNREQRRRRAAKISERRKLRWEQGLCTQCGKALTDKQYRMCLECRLYYRRRKEVQNRRNGVLPKVLLDGVNLCHLCGKAPPEAPYKLCPECLKSARSHLAKTPTHNGKKLKNYFALYNEVFYADKKQKTCP